MKLFTKLFLQIFAAFLVLSQVIFVYILHQSQKQNIENVTTYERNSLEAYIGKFQKALDKDYMRTEEESIKRIAVTNAFRETFGSKAVLYLDGQEILNNTPYFFDFNGILERLEKNDELGARQDSCMVKGAGKMLLVYSNETYLRYFPGYTIFYYKDVTDVYERTERLFYDGLAFTMLALGIIAGILFRGIRRTIRPLLELKKAAGAISGGCYDIRIPIKGRDEIGELTASFNQMAGKVEEHVEKLSATNEAQRRLLGSLAHELKTPMTAIIGYADTLLTVCLSDRRREQALHYIGNECRRLSRLSVKMMELTGLYETGETVLEKKQKKIWEFLIELKDLTAHRLKEKEIELVISCESRTLIREMDVDLMMSLLMNLVDNAYKASLPGSKITVRGDERGFTVEDTGKGIPREEIAHVTEAFYMVDKSRSRNAGSIGLGLALCRQIADMHGAELSIESEEGRGTRVRVLWS